MTMPLFAITFGHVVEIILDVLSAIVVLGFILWIFVYTLKRSEDPGLLIFKWILTTVCGVFWLFEAVPNILQGGVAALYALGLSLVLGLVMAITWRKNIASLVADPIGNLYTGGQEPPKPKPHYSQALTQRIRGNYQEAFNLVRQQLEKFPTDFEGWMLMADLQAENLNDLQGAAITIERICNQPEHPPRNIAMALNALADWYLKFNQDRDTARETLQRIIDRMPDTEMSVLAAQRIASLGSTEHLLARHDLKKFKVVEGVQNLGLLDPKFHPKPAEADVAKQAAQLVAHLQAHPLDAESREKLAVLYADHYNRLDLASDQLEQLINHPNQPPKRVVHWLNLLADLQIRHQWKYEAVRATLQRIVDLFPNSAASEVAASRIAHLKLELKGQQTREGIKLGTYEQDIGLKKSQPS